MSYSHFLCGIVLSVEKNDAAGLIKLTASGYVRLYDVTTFFYTSSAKHEDKLY